MLKNGKRQVVELNEGIFYPQTAMSVIRAMIVDTHTLQDHPDETAHENARVLLTKLIGTGILSKKTEALIAYDNACEVLGMFTRPEEEK